MTKTRMFLSTFSLVTLVLSLCIAVGAQNKRELERAQKFAQAGNQAYDRKDYRAAIRNYSEALKLAPISPALRFWKGKAHFNLQEYEDSYNDLTLALAQGHDSFAIFEIRYRVSYLLKRYDDALYDALEGAKLDPSKKFSESSLYNLVLGDIYRDKKQYALSNSYYKKGVKLDPENETAYYLMAMNHKELGEVRESGLACIEALKRGKTYESECSLGAADMYYSARKFDEAAELYEKVLTLNPDSYNVYINLSDLYRNENRFDLAIMTLRRAIKKYPSDGALLSNLSWNYSLADRPTEAVEAATQAIALGSTDATAYTNRCRAYIELQRFDLATASCNEALRLSPGDGETLLYLGRIYEAQNQKTKAADAYRKAVDGLLRYTRQNPNYSDGFYLLGNAYFKQLKLAEAIDAYKKCLALAPRFARARFTLGVAYLETNNRPLANEQYTLLLSIDSAMAAKLKAEIDR